MKKGLSIGSIVSVFGVGVLVFGSAVGISFGGTARIDDPAVFELSSRGLKQPGAVFNQYPLRDAKGRLSGFVSTGLIPDYEDGEGNPVAKERVSCTFTRGVGVICVDVWTFEAGPYTDRGTVSLTGIFKGLEDGTVNHYAVTGGTGAYRNVGGYVTEEIGTRWTVTFHLLP